MVNSLGVILAIIAIALFVVALILFILYRKGSFSKQDLPPAEAPASYYYPGEYSREFRCPNCDNPVDAYAQACPYCGVEFKEGEYECPRCSTPARPDQVECEKCGYLFEDNPFICPNCSYILQSDATECPNCHEHFWSPVHPAPQEIPEQATDVDNPVSEPNEADEYDAREGRPQSGQPAGEYSRREQSDAQLEQWE